MAARPAKMAAGEKHFMDHLLPDPTHPRVKIRTLAFGCLILFFTAVAWNAFVAPVTDLDGVEPGLGWAHYKTGSVQWGQAAQGSKSELANAETVDDWTSSDTATTKESFKGAESAAEGPFDTSKAASVSKLLKSGELFDYRWHATLNDWNSTEVIAERQLGDATDGRLIVLGDVHGMKSSVTALLTRLSFDPTRDTLLVVGDLVAKSTVDTSLETVALLRHLGAKGVRGNHDQGVIQWRRWMEAYGPSGATQTMESASAVAATESDDDMKVDETFTDDRRQKREQRRRAWWPWTEDESDTDEDVEAEAGEGYEEEGAAGDQQEITSSQSFGSPSSASVASSSASVSHNTTSSSSATPSGPVPHRRPLRPSRITSDSTSPSATPSIAAGLWHPTAGGLSSASTSSNGSLVGPGWSWLTISEKQARKLNVEVPKKWDWGGEWFEIARQMPKDDFEFLAQMPLTLHVKGLQTYLAHAGMLPWTNVKREIDSLSNRVPPTGPSLFTSKLMTHFEPDVATSQRLRSPARSLLLVPQNTFPFTLLNMRTLKFGKPSGKSHGAIGGESNLEITVSKGKKGEPWMEEWNRGMKECGSHKKCTPQSVLYGHWAGRGLEVKKHSIGLDSGCVFGKRLSALVLPKVRGDKATASPLSIKPLYTGTKPALDAYRKFPPGGMGLAKPPANPWADYPSQRKAAAVVGGERLEERMRMRRERRAPPFQRPSVAEVEEKMRQQMEDGGVASDEEEMPSKGDVDVEQTSSVNGDEDEPLDADTAAEDGEGQAKEVDEAKEKDADVTFDESEFEAQRVSFFDGRDDVWIVSVSCAAEAEALGLQN